MTSAVGEGELASSSLTWAPPCRGGAKILATLELDLACEARVKEKFNEQAKH